VWLTPHLRDPQPEGERERESRSLRPYNITLGSLVVSDYT